MSHAMFTLKPLGVVRATGSDFHLEIDLAYRPALNGLAGFSHLNVLWWCHFLDEDPYRQQVEVDQPYQQAPATLGIFATRSPMRPNPIALSIVPLLHVDVEGGVLHVAYLDAEDGTPILDIKPYHPAVDRVRDVTVPAWCEHWPQWYEDSATFDWAAEFVNAR